MALVAGIDSSTQSVKVVVRDAETGALVRQGVSAHPEGTEIHPDRWWEALQRTLDPLLDGVCALAVAGQQHGLVALDEGGTVVRPALLWNDTRSAPDAADLVAEFGGAAAWAQAIGSVPVADLTVNKARGLARCEPSHARRVATILLPHDWLTWRLLAAGDRSAGAVTDRGEASGTGYWSPASGTYRPDLLERALGHVPALPRVAAPAEIIGYTATGIALAPGTGDNMGAALALDLRPGDIAVSLGTSGTAFGCSASPTADSSGLVAGFADAAGGFLPLVCTLNAARVLRAAAGLLGVNAAGLSDLALAAAPGAEGLTLLPYLDGERTPNLPDARGSLHGLTRSNLTPANLARAAVEGMLAGLADAVDALHGVGVMAGRIVLIGGAAANPAVVEAARSIFPVPIVLPEPGEYVADGAARQAAWALSGRPGPPPWPAGAARPREFEPAPRPQIREAYTAARAALYG